MKCIALQSSTVFLINKEYSKQAKTAANETAKIQWE
jgi:hypothetical protein